MMSGSASFLCFATWCVVFSSYSYGWTTTSRQIRRPSPLRMNVLSDIGDFLSGGKLVEQTEPLPYGDSLGETSTDRKTLAIQERAISFTGEDFDVFDIDNNENFCRVRGAMLHLPGKDKMRIKRDGQVVATLDRKLMAMTPTYDILRGDSGEKIGWIEKAKIALTDTFEFHSQAKGGELEEQP